MNAMKFLVPVDFSSSAKNAGTYAAALAKVTNSSVIFLHVISPFVDDTTYLTTDVASVIGEAQKHLDQYVESITGQYGIHATGVVVKGETIEEILKMAETKKTKLIIMGTHEVNPLMKFFFGSTTFSVIEKSSASVLAVPENVSFAAPRNIVYASNYENSDIEALRELAGLASFFDAEINVVHISDEYDEPGTELSIIEYFSDLVKKHINYPKIVCRVFKHENPSKGIDIFARTVGAGMIALSTRKHGLLDKLISSSLTKEFIYNSTLPVIAFHQHELELSNEF